METKKKACPIIGKIVLALFSVAFIVFLGFIVFFLVATSEDQQTRKDALPYANAEVIGVPEIADSFIDEWEYKTEGRSFGEIAETYVIPEAGSEIMFYPGIKYVADDSNAMTDHQGLNQTFYFGKDKDNLVCALETYDYYIRSVYINKNYTFPEVGKNKAVRLILFDDYDCLIDYTTSKELHLFNLADEIYIDDPALVEKALDEYATGNGDFGWLKEHFDFQNDCDYVVLVEFENEIVYQLIGRVKADIEDLKNEIVSAAWREVCSKGNQDVYSNDCFDIFTTEKSYRVRFFGKDSEYEYYDLIKLEKSTLKPNYEL
ncbi:MAG: hypothetical protein J6L62_06665 [Clostridia bacterium]|nr:hypothetical protein [Clostridia bacterium]